MALNQKEAAMLERYVKAALAARAFMEPHPSWEHERLKAKALVAIKDACGASPGTDAIYETALRALSSGEASHD